MCKEKSFNARDRLQETLPPMIEGYCDHCGVKIDGPLTTKRGDIRKFCSTACRNKEHNMHRQMGMVVFRYLRDYRLFKHSDKDRANAARSYVDQFFADHFERMDAERQSHDPARPTVKDIRRAAKS